MTPDIIAVLTANGITPPKQGSNKTTCPMCSDYRVKNRQRCLTVKLTRKGVIWFCHHCHWEGEK